MKNLSFQKNSVKLSMNKSKKSILSFLVISLLLAIMFVIAVNTGSLSVSIGKLFKGLFVSYDADVATIYDLRFPRIFISILAGAAIAVSGVLFQAVLKNPLADPGIIGISSGAALAAVLIRLLPQPYFSSHRFLLSLAALLPSLWYICFRGKAA